MNIQPLKCTCGAGASAPTWSEADKAHVVRCSSRNCPAMSLGNSETEAIERWNIHQDEELPLIRDGAVFLDRGADYETGVVDAACGAAQHGLH